MAVRNIVSLKISTLLFAYILCLIIDTSSALSINYADSLTTTDHLQLLDSIAYSFTLDNCCDTTIGACIELKPACTQAPRFLDFISWMILRGHQQEKIIKELEKRVVSFFGPDTFLVNSSLPLAGAQDAPVIISSYISASCPRCKKVCIPLYLAVTDGPLYQLAKLQLIPATVSFGNMALLAAHEQGKFWDFFLKLEGEKRRLNERILMSKARKLGLNTKQFKRALYNNQYKKVLTQSRNKARNNGVTITPTLFINKRRYRSYKNPQWIIDAVEYEVTRELDK